MKNMYRACCQFQRNNSYAFVSVNQHVHEVKLIKKRYVVLDALLVQCLEDHVTGAIGGVTSPFDGRFAKIPGVTAEAALVNLPFRCPAKG